MKQTNITLSNNSAFLVNHWPLFKCFNRIPLFGKTIGIPLAQMVSAGEDIEDALADSLFLLFTNLEQVSPETIIKTLLEGTLAYPKEGGTPVPVDVETHCDGDMAAVLELCAKVFQAHYGSMFKKEGFEGLSKLAQGMAGLSA